MGINVEEGGTGEVSDLCRLESEGPRGGPLNMKPRGAAMDARTVRASGCSWWGGSVCSIQARLPHLTSH